MNKQVLKQIKRLRLGDNIQIRWFDASKGEFSIDERVEQEPPQFDIPVRSIGWFLGVVGRTKKYVLLLRDDFDFQGTPRHDVDFNSIPIGMIEEIGPAEPLPKDIAFMLASTAKAKIKAVKQRGRKSIYVKEVDG